MGGRSLFRVPSLCASSALIVHLYPIPARETPGSLTSAIAKKNEIGPKVSRGVVVTLTEGGKCSFIKNISAKYLSLKIEFESDKPPPPGGGLKRGAGPKGSALQRKQTEPGFVINL